MLSNLLIPLLSCVGIKRANFVFDSPVSQMKCSLCSPKDEGCFVQSQPRMIGNLQAQLRGSPQCLCEAPFRYLNPFVTEIILTKRDRAGHECYFHSLRAQHAPLQPV